MKQLLTIIILISGLLGYAQHEASMPTMHNMGLRNNWSEYGYGRIIKFADITYRYSHNSRYLHNAEGLFYPINFFRMDDFPIDVAVGGGISFADHASYGYGKLFLGKEILTSNKNYNSGAKYRLAIGGYSDFMFGNGSQRFGFDLINTFPISYTLKTRLLLGTSYHTLEKEWKVNIGISIALEDYYEPVQVKKPVIYAYSDDTISTTIQFKFDGPLTFVYPAYHDQWDITVLPNAILIDNNSQKQYPYLFWEGDYQLSMIPSVEQGFIVQQTDMITFLEEKLEMIGLNDREKTDFITFWAPQLNAKQYVVKFLQQEQCDGVATYSFSNSPESFLRLYVTFEEANGSIQIEEQKLQKIERTGFTIVEWGGMTLPKQLVMDK